MLREAQKRVCQAYNIYFKSDSNQTFRPRSRFSLISQVPNQVIVSIQNLQNQVQKYLIKCKIVHHPARGESVIERYAPVALPSNVKSHGSLL